MNAFAPIISFNPKVLILGSMPSRVSLSEQQYYGNSNNAFWWIMSELLGFSLELDYLSRVDKLKSSPFSVWDVLSDCERPGSLDANIVKASEVPNDIEGFLKIHSDVSLLAFNGAAAKTIFLRHNVIHVDSLQRQSPPEMVQLPSTSPAYASMKKDEKLRLWAQAFENHL